MINKFYLSNVFFALAISQKYINDIKKNMLYFSWGEFRCVKETEYLYNC